MSEATRPKRVVIVDADDPLREVHGEFFWCEDHDRIVAAEQAAAFDRGYAAGYSAAQRQVAPRLLVRYRRRGLGWMLRWSLATLVTVGFLVSLIQSITHS